MGQVNIKSLYRFLTEYQELDPEIARKLLKRILEILQDMRENQAAECPTRKEERVDNSQ